METLNIMEDSKYHKIYIYILLKKRCYEKRSKKNSQLLFGAKLQQKLGYKNNFLMFNINNATLQVYDYY